MYHNEQSLPILLNHGIFNIENLNKLQEYIELYNFVRMIIRVPNKDESLCDTLTALLRLISYLYSLCSIKIFSSKCNLKLEFFNQVFDQSI